MNLVLIKPSECTTDTGAVDLPADDDRTKHILGHLAKTTGDTVSVGFVNADGGSRCKAVVLQRQNGGIRLVPKANTVVKSPPLPEITLVLAVPFPARLNYLWAVVSSFVSVTRIVVVKGRLSNHEHAFSRKLKPDVYEPMVETGMSQGGRTRPVKVDVCTQEELSRELMERLGLARGGGSDDDGVARVFLDCGDEQSTPPPARDVVLEQCGKDSECPRAIVAVGPERGWTDEEAKLFVNECGFRSAMIGSSIFRVDTAVVAGLGIVSAALDECQKQPDREIKRKRVNSPVP